MKFDVHEAGSCKLAKQNDWTVFLTTLPNGDFEIHVGPDEFNGTIVAEGSWRAYNKNLTRDAFELLMKGQDE